MWHEIGSNDLYPNLAWAGIGPQKSFLSLIERA